MLRLASLLALVICFTAIAAQYGYNYGGYNPYGGYGYNPYGGYGGRFGGGGFRGGYGPYGGRPGFGGPVNPVVGAVEGALVGAALG